VRVNWSGNVQFSAADQAVPTSVEELQQVVTGSARVRALGTAHSFSTVADTTGTLISTSGLKPPIEVLPEERVAVVPAGATYAEVATALHREGWALHNLGSLPHISVGGACSTGTHGSGNRLGNLSTAVVGVELVRADGELVRSAVDDADFSGMVLALGCLGVMTRLWLRIEPAFDVRQQVFTDVSRDLVVERVQEIFESAYSVSIFSSFTDPQLMESIWFKARTDGPERGGPESVLGTEPADQPQHPIRGQDTAAATEQGGVPGAWHDRLPHFRMGFTPSVGHELQSEFLMPRVVAGEVIEALHGLGPELSGALQVFEMRTIAGDDLWLSPSRGRDSVAAHFTWRPEWEIVRPALERVESVLAPFDPRPHWGKVFLDRSPQEMDGLYPELPRFRELRDAMDPDRRFGNTFVEGLIGG